MVFYIDRFQKRGTMVPSSQGLLGVTVEMKGRAGLTAGCTGETNSSCLPALLGQAYECRLAGMSGMRTGRRVMGFFG